MGFKGGLWRIVEIETCSCTEVSCMAELSLLQFLSSKLSSLDLQCCSYYHLPKDVSSKFQSVMTIFRHNLLTKEGRVLANG